MAHRTGQKIRPLKKSQIKYTYGSVQISRNQLLPISGPPPLRNQDNHGLYPPPTPLKWLRNMWIETTTFDVNNATKNYNKILDLGPYKGSGVGYA